MPVEWPFAREVIQLGGMGVHKIATEDGARQQETARSILADLIHRPGVILADEVGMGKTYVALGVVASVLLATRRSTQPVIVMMPPGLASKWRREWEQFKVLCCIHPEALSWVRDAHPHTPTEFFKLLDDPAPRRPRLIWMTTNCFYAGLSDPWVKLALIRLARSRTRMDDETKKRLYKWATDLVRLKSKRGLTPDLIETLLRAEPTRWHRVLVREGILEEDEDDPVPEHLLQHEGELDWSGLTVVLRGEAIPGRRGVVSQHRLTEARGDFNEACQDVYWQWLARAKWRASLLVLDEAHHAKNDNTRLASLFRSEDTTRLLTSGGEAGDHPLFWDKFDRMLFLTATPFQLGHHELIRVLRSFMAARWSGPAAPAGMREEFETAMKELERRLDENRLAGRRLDRLWGRLGRDNIGVDTGHGDLTQKVREWWQRLNLDGSSDPFEKEILRTVEECRQTKARAESDPTTPSCALKTWVIRHNRPKTLPQEDGKSMVPRRDSRYGVAIAQNEEDLQRGTEGLPIAGEDALPFLLAARAQGELAAGSTKARAFFAEGLCSSYEAFHHTRDARGDVRDMDDEGIEDGRSTGQRPAEERSIVPVSWYETHIEKLIPSKVAPDEERYRHPKIRAVVDHVVRLWLAGEKVLVFCFYRETARALRRHIGREVERAMIELAARKLGLDPQHEAEEVRNWFTRIGRRFADRDSPFHHEMTQILRQTVFSPEFSILTDRAEELVELLSAYVRSPSFVARYLPIEVPEVREALVEGENRPHLIRAGVTALSQALTERADESAMTMLRRVEEFLRFAKDEAERGQRRIPVEDGEQDIDPLREYLTAVAVYVSPRHTEEDDDEEARIQPSSDGTYRAPAAVRMVYGETPRDVRERLMLAFNSPLFPEVLISSAVLGEGVDLHRFCRHVIHHDLCWNPSTLEQRTGRLDRIRCKAEVSRRSIVVYEPFLAGSADEKMFRVVRDRERWFQIVMGQKFEFDEATSEQLANRVPLPEGLARELIFDLRRVL